MITTYPDEPTLLINEVGVTSATQIGISWTIPVSNGGTSIIDYRVKVAESGSNFF